LENVGGKNALGKDRQEVAQLLSGEEGSSVNLKFRREIGGGIAYYSESGVPVGVLRG